MSKLISLIFLLFLSSEFFSLGCLITNCPRGGKRSRFHLADTASVKPCVSCGPGLSGQCFGPSICCGPFGCLLGTPETLKCQREGYFHEREPCVAGTGTCRKNTGRCAFDGICCSQDACYTDKSCTMGEDDKLGKLMAQEPDFYSLLNNYQQLEQIGEK